MEELYLSGSGREFGFKHIKINTINELDRPISKDVYNKFFKEQERGKQFRIKNNNGDTFEEIFEEVFEELV